MASSFCALCANENLEKVAAVFIVVIRKQLMGQHDGKWHIVNFGIIAGRHLLGQDHWHWQYQRLRYLAMANAPEEVSVDVASLYCGHTILRYLACDTSQP